MDSLLKTLPLILLFTIKLNSFVQTPDKKTTKSITFYQYTFRICKPSTQHNTYIYKYNFHRFNKLALGQTHLTRGISRIIQETHWETYLYRFARTGHHRCISKFCKLKREVVSQKILIKWGAELLRWRSSSAPVRRKRRG